MLTGRGSPIHHEIGQLKLIHGLMRMRSALKEQLGATTATLTTKESNV